MRKRRKNRDWAVGLLWWEEATGLRFSMSISSSEFTWNLNESLRLALTQCEQRKHPSSENKAVVFNSQPCSDGEQCFLHESWMSGESQAFRDTSCESQPSVVGQP